ncbi:DUF4132 domain-containing protein [Streptomyces sp. NPDC088729]|uniref:DUF4132 domain-containing protein n=1 Tax=Streptomyces sp. NPDC088729 TaxID=3365876 RepID=UPI00380012A3
MRRWEFHREDSSKFWEAGLSGTTVTVRYGRTGTQGQEQHKEFADDAAARAHLARTITQKERKGYQEVTAGATPAVTVRADTGTAEEPETPVPDAPAPETPAPDAPVPANRRDEDTFRLPATWRERMYPRRGGAPRRPAAPDPALHARTLESLRDRGHWTPATFSERTDPALVRAALAHLEGAADPFGAAVIGTMATTLDIGRAALVDAWAAAHGLPFAACAAVAMLDVEVAWEHEEDPRLARLRDKLWNRSFALFARADSADESDELAELGNSVSDMTGPIHPSVAAVTVADPPLRHGRREALDRVRELLAACDDETYHEAVARLAERRDGFARQVVAAYLAPAETDWVADCFADPALLAGLGGDLRALLRCLPVTAEQISILTAHDQEPPSPAEFATVADGAGTAVEGLVTHGLEVWGSWRHGYRNPTDLRRALLHVPTDRAFSFLLDRVGDKAVRPYVVQAAERYPVRALRLLARAAAADGPDSVTRSLLVSHLGAHPELTEEHLRTLDAPDAETVRTILEGSGQLPDATNLPDLLTSPPWTKPRRTARARTVPGLTPPAEPREAWLPGEREEWAATPSDYVPWPWPQSMRYDEGLLREGRLSDQVRVAGWYMELPTARIAPLLDDWAPRYFSDGREVLRPFTALFGLTAHTFLVRLAARQPHIAGRLLMPFVSADIARIAADWLVRLAASAPVARAWLDRHGPRAAELLVPDAVGPTGGARRAAEAALLRIASRHGDTAVREAAEAYGTEAAAVIGQLIDTADPLLTGLPRTMPKAPDWSDPGLLPQIAVRTGGALPAEATRHVITMLALCKPGAPYPGLDTVQEFCEPDSLAEFAWCLFQRWRQAHMPAKESWALTALGRVGDDGTVRRLTPVIRAWPGESAHRRAVDGLDVLAEIGTDVALTHLHGIAQRVKFTGLKERAGEKIAEVAATRGLTPDQLSDRLVPDLGLRSDGTTVIDYGPRRFTVGFDELLRPYVLDGGGKRRKDLPKPGAADDTDLATAERKRFSALKKDVRTVARDRIRRLETAMVRGGDWTATEFRELFAHHPLMRHLSRRLVWRSSHPSGDRTFRVTEDGSLTGQGEEAYALPDDATVTLPHPLHLADAVDAWREVFAAHGILQPFPQLARPVLAFTPEEAKGRRLPRFEKESVAVGALLGLTERGWQRMEVLDAGSFGGVSKVLGPGRTVSVTPDDGFNINDIDYAGTVELADVSIDGNARQGDACFGEIDALTASELLLDLTSLLDEPR